MMNYPKYESYKDSGIDWLGETPSDWELAPLRKIFSFRNEKNDPVITDNILSLSIAHGVTEYSDEGRGGNKRKDDLSAYKIARPNDIVINSMNVIVGAVGLSKYFGAISPVYYAMYVRNRSYSEYFYEYIFRNEGFQRGLLRLGKGILIKISDSGKMNTIRMKISQDDLKVLKLPLPSIQEQNFIAKFLDQKTTQLDEAIGIKEKQIELLKEQKQIMIQNAVTKGLDPNVKMKDSGVDWIGKIPEHWEVKKLKYLLSESTSRSITGEEELLSLSGYKGVIPRYLLEDRAGLAESLIGYKLVNKGNLVINRMQAVNGLLAVSQYNGLTSPDYAVYVERHKDLLDLTYIYFLLRLPIYLAEFKKRVTGVMEGFIRLYTDDLYDISISLPSYAEQKKIIQFIDNNLQKNSCAENNLINQIAKLKEYKTTLINSAVTGKIKVTPEMVGEA